MRFLQKTGSTLHQCRVYNDDFSFFQSLSSVLLTVRLSRQTRLLVYPRPLSRYESYIGSYDRESPRLDTFRKILVKWHDLVTRFTKFGLTGRNSFP